MATRKLIGKIGTIAPLYFLLGAFSLVFQTILLREFFTVAAGNEISFAFALGGWLLGVGAGSFCSGLLSTRQRPGTNTFPWVVVLMCISAPLVLAGIRCLRQISAVPQGALITLSRTFWLIPLLTIPFSFFSGFIFPLAVKLEPDSTLSNTPKMVRAYIWECLGALTGGILYTFWLLEKFNSVMIISLFTLPLLLCSAYVTGLEKRKKALAIHFLLLIFNLYAILAGGAGRLDLWLVQQRWQGLSGAKLLENRDSKYQSLQLGLSHSQYSLYSNGQLAAVFPDDDQQRIQAAQIITQHPQPRRILIIGEGASGLAKHLLQYKIVSLTAVEMDGMFLDLILNHLSAAAKESLRDPRLRLEVLDGRRFVMAAARAPDDPKNKFDLVYLQQPDAWTAQLNRYYTREFFMDIKAILSSGGVVTMRITSAENYASEITNPYTATIYHTLKSVFPNITVAPGQMNFFSASSMPDSISTNPAILAERYLRLAFPPADLSAIFSSLYPDEKTRFGKKSLERYQVPFMNRDQQPIAYFLWGRLLGWTSGSPLSGLFDFFEKMKFSYLLIFIVLLLYPAFLWVSLRKRRAPGSFSILLAAASGGFAGLSFEILAIFSFQNIWGYVYQTIGLLIAVFMLGMGAGAALTSRYLKKKQPLPKRSRKILAGNQFFIAITGLSCLPLMNFFAKKAGYSEQILLFLWLGGMGFLIGAILPLALYIYGRESAAKKAGFLNAADYLGGTIGALAMASFFLPLYGSANSLLLITVPALTTSLFLLIEAGFNDHGSA